MRVIPRDQNLLSTNKNLALKFWQTHMFRLQAWHIRPRRLFSFSSKKSNMTGIPVETFLPTSQASESGSPTAASPLKKKPRLHSSSPPPLGEISYAEEKPALQLSTPQKAPEKLSRKARQKQKRIKIEQYSSEDVVFQDVKNLLGNHVFEKAISDGSDWNSPFEHREEVQLVVSSLTSTGKLPSSLLHRIPYLGSSTLFPATILVKSSFVKTVSTLLRLGYSAPTRPQCNF